MIFIFTQLLKKELISALHNQLVLVSGIINVFAINYLNLYGKALINLSEYLSVQKENLTLNLHFLPSPA